jgi:glycine/D-amino acid oxidase-like deaminating enzyme
MGTAVFDVAIIGAGVVGCSVAYELAKRKARVILIDKNCAAGEVSGGNFGQLWVQSKFPAWYLGVTLESAASYVLFVEGLRSTGIDVEYRREGGLELIFTAKAFAARKTKLELQRKVPGFTAELISPAEVGRLEPAINIRAIAGAVYSPHDGNINPFLLCRALAKAARVHGAESLMNTEVTGFKIASGHIARLITTQGEIRAAAVVNATGLDVNRIQGLAGENVLPVIGSRGQILVTEPVAPLLKRPTSKIRQTANGNVLIGSTTELGSINRQGRLTDVHNLASIAVNVIPALAEVCCIRTWSMPRVWPVDGLPIFECGKEVDNLYTVATHSALSLCPYIGATVTDWITEGKTPRLELRLTSERSA